MNSVVKKDKHLWKRRRLNSADDGVAATVGTIMALLVFLSLLSLITNQYVPVWKEDTEAYHMDEVMTQFSYFKGNIDSLIMNDFTDYPMYSTVRLGSEGVPLFAFKTRGELELSLRNNMWLNFTEGGTARSFAAKGSLSLNVFNMEYEPQTHTYEHGAIILEQSDRAVIRAPPPIRIEKHGSDYLMQLTMVDIIGSEESISGSGAVGVTTELWSTSRRSVDNPGDLTIEFTTRYPDAWETWFREETEVENITVVQNGELSKITINVYNISTITYTYAKVNVRMST